MATQTVTIQNAYGIHCRPSAIIAQAAREYDGEVRLSDAAGETIDAKSILLLVSLGMRVGARATVTVSGGSDDSGACTRLAALLQRNFDFPRDG